jgi:23S rRNA pseudouridine1911/1915/1917 synthase
MTEQTLDKAVPEHLTGQRLDSALAQMFPEFSRSRLKQWILAGHVTIDGRVPKPRDTVAGGEQIMLNPQSAPQVTSEPEAIALDIVYEDDDLLVVDKPVGLVVHPGAGNLRGTLMNGLLHHVPALKDLPRAGIIHRLDKETSGLLLVGKHLAAHTALTRLLADREISRDYLAICNGVLTGGGTIEAPIGRHPVDRRKMAIRDDGKPAITHYRVVERFRAHTYISVSLETGRTHQIRVHFASRRHPLLGDPTYGGRLQLPRGASEALIEALRGFRRQALHATRLGFVHPVTGESLSLERPPPADFGALLSVLRDDAKDGS